MGPCQAQGTKVCDLHASAMSAPEYDLDQPWEVPSGTEFHPAWHGCSLSTQTHNYLIFILQGKRITAILLLVYINRFLSFGLPIH